MYNLVAEGNPTYATQKKAADAYFEAYTYAVEEDKRMDLATRAKSLYDQILEKNPEDFDAQVNLGLLIVGTESPPMRGILLLREVADEKDTTNYKALFNLGIFSMETGQNAKALERFERLVRIYPDDLQSRFNLARCYLELGQKDEARKQFEIVKQTDSDPEVQSIVDSYLEEIE